MKKLTIQVFSDLHLELTKNIPKITPIAPILFLAGDISRVNHNSFITFLSYCNNNWDKTFYTFGNHDYWDNNSHMQYIKQQTNELLKTNKLTNIHILDNNFVSLTDDIIVFGSTFWTKNCFTKNESRMYLNDYNMIKYCDVYKLMPTIDYISPTIINKIHSEQMVKLYETLNQNELTKDKKIIIMTHFPPQRTNTSHSKYSNQHPLLSSYFSHPDDTISNLGDTSNILCWISGHTHFSYDFINVNGVRLISNQMGYVKEMMTNESNFDENGLFEITI